MSFTLHRAERSDVLVDVLAEVFAVAPADPFAPEVVAVHSRGVERWLTNRLAARLGASDGRADGVCANLRFPFPGRLVSDALASATGVRPADDPWRPQRLAWPLLEVVDANLGAPWLAVLAAHLGGAGAADHADRDRRFAAVRHLADLYDRYAVHRPAMVRAWAAGDDTDGTGSTLPDDARWQAEAWRHLRSLVGTASPAERLVGGVAALADDPSLVDLPDRLSLFGMTRLPASYLEVLDALALHRDVHVLALHPSPQAWDALAADPAHLVRHPLLAAWGRDSREMQVVLGGVASLVDRHHPLPDAGGPTTLLRALQAGVRGDERPTPTVALDPDDRTVQVHSCHGPARQAEVVRDAIAHLMVADPTLEPRDVVVLCPDIEELAPLLHSAFADARSPLDLEAGGPPAIPYRLADRSLRQTNPMLGAVADLLVLADGRLTASQVLAFAALEPVRERFGFDDDDLGRIAGWVADTGTRWGLDGLHRTPYDLAAVEAGTWRSGLVRILLGVAMTEDGARLVGGALPLDDVDAGDIDLAGRLAELVDRLGHVVRGLAAGPRPIDGWLDAIDRAADLLLHARSSASWQRHQVDQLVDDVRGQARGTSPDLRLAEVRDLLADRLRGQPTRAAFRTGDLTLCTLVPMRSVPHRVVCIVGLDDGAFPRGTAPDGDDLLVRSRSVGDHDRRSEDRQLLLDAVLAATDALVITYSGRDPRTNEVLPSAVPVHELLDVLDATASTVDGRPVREHVVRAHPLQPSDPSAFAATGDGPWSFDPAMLDGARAAVRPEQARPPVRAVRLPQLPEDVIELDDLATFVQHPVRGFLRQRLGMSLRTDEDLPQDALVLELDGLAAWGVGDRMLRALLAGGDLDAVTAAEEARGLLPPGALGVQVLANARAKAEGIFQAVGVALGAGPKAAPTSLEIEVGLADGRRVVGVVPDVVGTTISSTTYSTIKAKQRLLAWTRFVAATAAHPGRPLRSVTIGGAKGSPRTVAYGSLGASAADRAGAALAHLEVLVDLRDRGLREPLLLPIEASRRYADAVGSGLPAFDAEREAAGYWTSSYDWDKEDREAEHVLVLGGQVPFDALLVDAPAPDESGPGWAMGEATRFGRLARRLWDPVLVAEQQARR